MLQRVKQIIALKSRSDASFAKEIGVGQTTLSSYLTGKRNLSLEVIDKILQTYPDVSAEWLLRGNGGMFIKEGSSTTYNVASQVVQGDNSGEMTYGGSERNKLISQINELKKDKEVLQEQLALVKEMFNLLKK